MILSKAELQAALDDSLIYDDRIDETINALYAALEAWVEWVTDDRDNHNNNWLIVCQLTKAARIEWPK